MASAQEWQQRVQAWQASGLTPSIYCRQHGFNAYTFTGWRKRFATSPASHSAVMPIQVVPAVPAPAAVLVLRLAAGHHLELPASVAPAWVAELLQCLG